MKGRKPVPSAVKALRGNPGRRPVNADEPASEVPDETFNTPPAMLTGAAAAEWTRLAPMLRLTRQIGESDKSALVALCIEWARYLEAMAKVREVGMVVKTPRGYPIANPYLSVATKALAACNKLWPELGLTPSSRSRVHVVGAPAASKAQRFMSSAPKLRIVKS